MLRLRARLAVASDRLGISHFLLAASRRLPSAWQRLTIVTWHRVAKNVAPGFDPGTVSATPEQFDRQIAMLKASFSIIDIAALARYHDEGRALPPCPALLTFDDGYRDNLTVAVPILKKHRAHAVFFVSTGFMEERKLFPWEWISAIVTSSRRSRIDVSYPEPMSLGLGDDVSRRMAVRRLIHRTRTWVGLDWTRFAKELAETCESPWDRDKEAKAADELILDWAGVRALVEEGMDVQSHGHSHALFPYISADDIHQELSTSRQLLERHLGRPPSAVAYPAGAYPIPGTPRYHAVERAGYRFGFRLDQRTRMLGGITDWLSLPRLCSDPGLGDDQFRSMLAFPNILR